MMKTTDAPRCSTPTADEASRYRWWWRSYADSGDAHVVELEVIDGEPFIVEPREGWSPISSDPRICWAPCVPPGEAESDPDLQAGSLGLSTAEIAERYPTTDARALIVEGRKHDEVMTEAPWEDWPGAQGLQSFPRVLSAMKPGGRDRIAVIQSWEKQPENAAGIAWLRTNLRALLDGYELMLDEVDILRADAAAREQQLVTTMDGLIAERNAARAEVERLRTDLDTVSGIRDREQNTAVMWETKCDDALARVATRDEEIDRLRPALREACALLRGCRSGDGHPLITTGKIDALLAVANGRPCPICGKPSCRPMEHAGWDPSKEMP